MNVHGVIMAGGSGTRFWPLSRRALPKQLLPLFDGRTLLELTVERLRPLVPIERLRVVTGPHLAAPIAKLLPDLPRDNLIVEPSARSTLPCIALAAAHIRRSDPDGTMAIFSADQYIDDDAAFLRSCKTCISAARQGPIATIGIAPSRPETGFGYIRYTDGPGPAHPVEAFVEKPDRPTAERYLDEGHYLWNSGTFFLRLATFADEMARQQPEAPYDALCDGVARADRQALVRAFEALPATSIDYGVMEEARDVVVVRGRFGWHDVGHWAALDEVLPTDAAGNVTLGDVLTPDTRDSVIVSQSRSGKVVAVLGLKDIVVVDTDDATLVLPRGQAQRVREVVAELAQRDREDLL